MASPHTAGVAALYLESNPAATPATVPQVARIDRHDEADHRLDRRFYPGTANLLLFTDH